MSRGKKFHVDRRVGIAISALSPPQQAAVSRVLQSAQSFAIDLPVQRSASSATAWANRRFTAR